MWNLEHHGKMFYPIFSEESMLSTLGVSASYIIMLCFSRSNISFSFLLLILLIRRVFHCKYYVLVQAFLFNLRNAFVSPIFGVLKSQFNCHIRQLKKTLSFKLFEGLKCLSWARLFSIWFTHLLYLASYSLCSFAVSAALPRRSAKCIIQLASDNWLDA